MRMWMVPPQCLCRKHLGGEYSEIFKHKHNFEKKHSMLGRIHPIVLIEPENMAKRVEELREEGLRRGYNYKAKYKQPNLDYLPDEIRYAKVDIELSKLELSNRCNDCKNLIEKHNDRTRKEA